MGRPKGRPNGEAKGGRLKGRPKWEAKGSKGEAKC